MKRPSYGTLARSPADVEDTSIIHEGKKSRQNRSVQLKFMLRDGDTWVNVDEFSVGPADHSIVRRKAEEHLHQGRFLFDSELWSLYPSDCFDAAIASGTNTIFLIPMGRICVE